MVDTHTQNHSLKRILSIFAGLIYHMFECMNNRMQIYNKK